MENNKKPIRTKDESHLIPEWQKTPEYLSFLEAKKAWEEAKNCGCSESGQLEELENKMRESHLALVHYRVNTFSQVDFTIRGTGKGGYIS